MSNMTAKRTVTLDTWNGYKVEIHATWSGGTYIDLHWNSPEGNVLEVINVYDYRSGKIKDDVNVSRELSEWIRETGIEEIRNYYRHTA